jgi:cytochrome P450
MSLARTRPAGLPRPLPLVGHALQLLRRPWDFLANARPLGDIVEIRLGPAPAYLLNSPELIRQVLVIDAKKFDKGVQFDKLRPILGNGLVTAAGQEHLRRRRLVQPAFHRSRIAQYAETMRQAAAEKSASWQAGEQIALDQELMQLTLRIVGKTLFSTELGSAAAAEVVRSMPILLGGITKRAFEPTGLLEKLPTAENRRFNQANRRLREVVDRIIAEYRRNEADHGDVLSMLLLARDEQTGQGMSDAQVRDEVVTLLIAGTETIANTLSWSLHVLGQRPDVEARLHAEVDDVLAGGEMTFEHIGRLAYTRRVITETLRLYPPAWLISRRAKEPVTLGGRHLPAGASIMFSPYSLQRDDRWYADAKAFDPDRWLPERAKEIPRPAFIPFGAGNRQCIGEGFAWTEAIVTLATIAAKWRLRPAPNVEVRMTAGATMAPSQLPMTPWLRTHSRAQRRPDEALLAGARG